MASKSYSTNGNDDGLTLTALGCGTMGVAILSGILASLSEDNQSTEELPPHLPNRFIACVRRLESAKKVKETLSTYGQDVTALADENLKGVEKADVILLACKPYMFRGILSADGMKEALAGKLLISILAGVSVGAIEETLYGSTSNKSPEEEGRCRIVRAMPNTASGLRESMTVIATSTPSMKPEQEALVTWMFSRIGRVAQLPPHMLDASTALCGSGPAFMLLILEAMADGGVAMGIPRAEAQIMSAQVMRGASAMVLNGEHPAVLKDKVCTPGGCTIGGLMTLEEGSVRGTVSRAVRTATEIASGLGKPK